MAKEESDVWETSASDPATLANTEDWGTTASIATKEEWSELETKTAKIEISKKPVVKKKSFKSANLSAAPAATGISAVKTTNWAQVVKG